MVSTTVLVIVASMWWLVNVPYAAAGLIAIDQPAPIAWLAAVFFPAAGTAMASSLAKMEAAGRDTGPSRFITLALLSVFAYGYAALSYPVDNPGHGPWYLGLYMGGMDVMVAYALPHLFFTFARTKPAKSTEST
ncbi:hypothetical protein ACFWA9_04285 [Kitasatospora sp. NPDC059973]|uniref:hypothetical protein n=1 Tax=Kitasatospora sp. NPDC059973 TaxID=3347020 RepID=UPI0036C643C4